MLVGEDWWGEAESLISGQLEVVNFCPDGVDTALGDGCRIAK